MIAALLFAVGQISRHTAAGWVAGPDAGYTAETLHTYIDGASEVYRALNVQRVVARRYAREGSPDILLDLFEMKTGSDAFGAYHHDVREGEEVGIGCESEYEGTSLAFWKGRFVVYATAPRPAEGVRDAVLEIGRQVAAGITEECAPPALVGLLPETGLQRDWLRYFHNHVSLNLYYSVADENLLNLGADTEGVLARYRTGDGGRLTCLVLRYPDSGAAGRARESFLSRYVSGPREENAGRTAAGHWAGAQALGGILAVVLDAPGWRELDEKLGQIAQAAGQALQEEGGDHE